MTKYQIKIQLREIRAAFETVKNSVEILKKHTRGLESLLNASKSDLATLSAIKEDYAFKCVELELLLENQDYD
jgi:hypothetical protein